MFKMCMLDSNGTTYYGWIKTMLTNDFELNSPNLYWHKRPLVHENIHFQHITTRFSNRTQAHHSLWFQVQHSPDSTLIWHWRMHKMRLYVTWVGMLYWIHLSHQRENINSVSNDWEVWGSPNLFWYMGGNVLLLESAYWLQSRGPLMPILGIFINFWIVLWITCKSSKWANSSVSSYWEWDITGFEYGTLWNIQVAWEVPGVLGQSCLSVHRDKGHPVTNCLTRIIVTSQAWYRHVNLPRCLAHPTLDSIPVWLFTWRRVTLLPLPMLQWTSGGHHWQTCLNLLFKHPQSDNCTMYGPYTSCWNAFLFIPKMGIPMEHEDENGWMSFQPSQRVGPSGHPVEIRDKEHKYDQ